MSLEGTRKNIEFRDNTRTFLEMFDRALFNGLEAIGMTAETYAKKECPVDTGRLRNSITNEIPRITTVRGIFCLQNKVSRCRNKQAKVLYHRAVTFDSVFYFKYHSTEDCLSVLTDGISVSLSMVAP